MAVAEDLRLAKESQDSIEHGVVYDIKKQTKRYLEIWRSFYAQI